MDHNNHNGRKGKSVNKITKIAATLSLSLMLSLSGFVSLAAADESTTPVDTAQTARSPIEPADCLKCGYLCGRTEVERNFQHYETIEGKTYKVYEVIYNYDCSICGGYNVTNIEHVISDIDI